MTTAVSVIPLAPLPNSERILLQARETSDAPFAYNVVARLARAYFAPRRGVMDPDATKLAATLAGDILWSVGSEMHPRQENLSDAARVAVIRVRAALESAEGDGSLLDGALFLVEEARWFLAQPLADHARSQDGEALRARLGEAKFQAFCHLSGTLTQTLNALRELLYAHASTEMQTTVGPAR